MRFLIQRVQKANVTVEEESVGSIGKGILVFVGIEEKDTEKEANYLVNKLIHLRIFEDENGKMNLSIKQTKGELLVVSQFTLYADCSHGNRPSFMQAAKPEKAKELYQYIVQTLKREIAIVETGLFGAYMEVELVNDGPVTILLEN